MGTNCRFLQGADTDKGAVRQVREAIEGRHDIAIDLLNYRKDGTPFWNALYLSPVVNEGGELLFYFASQMDVTDRVDAHIRTLADKEHFERQVALRTRDLTEALAAKTMLVHEVDHRVKNNLQMISSLLTMQTRTIKDPAARATMESMLHRIEALGTVATHQTSKRRDQFLRDSRIASLTSIYVYARSHSVLNGREQNVRGGRSMRRKLP